MKWTALRTCALALVAVLMWTNAAVPVARAADAPRNLTTPAPGSPEAELLAVEDARFAAQIAHDAKTAAKYMADDMIYTHATGRVQTKADYVHELATGNTPYRVIEPSSRSVFVSGDVGLTHATIFTDTAGKHLTGTYLAAYVKRDGRWQLLYWQTSQGYDPSARVPPPSDPASAH
ncbi:MAG TPA: nuclear transport factor 2 family protein [Caulobacteraceae bacterium]|nr:nuclear transport factor 2 family protein [Caulobacteraceae bacterium]